MADGTDWIGRLNEVSQINDLDSALTRLLFLPIAAFFVQFANAIEAISRILIDPAMAFAGGVESIVVSLLGGRSAPGRPPSRVAISQGGAAMRSTSRQHPQLDRYRIDIGKAASPPHVLPDWRGGPLPRP